MLAGNDQEPRFPFLSPAGRGLAPTAEPLESPWIRQRTQTEAITLVGLQMPYSRPCQHREPDSTGRAVHLLTRRNCFFIDLFDQKFASRSPQFIF